MSAYGSRTNNALQARLLNLIRTEWYASCLVLMALSFGLSLFGNKIGLQTLNNTLYDSAVANVGNVPVSKDIIIIAIDDNSIDELGMWPWPRSLHASLLSYLGQAKAVALDILFTEENNYTPVEDRILEMAVISHGKVIIPSMVNIAKDTIVQPYKGLHESAWGSGHINIQLDKDGAARTFIPAINTAQGTRSEHITLTMLSAAEDHDIPSIFKGFKPVHIAWAGEPATFTILPYHKVLSGEITPETFKDKFVLIGSWASGLGDVFITPTTTVGIPMAGVEVLANILNNIIQDKWIKVLPPVLTASLNMLPIVLCFIGLWFLSPHRAFILTAVIVTACFLIAWVILQLWMVWISPTGAVIGVALAYPVWSWRSQQTALRHIEKELQNLHQTPIAESRGPLTKSLADLHEALELSRRSERQREETIRFLSHDMRSPLTSILALCHTHNIDNSVTPDSSQLKTLTLLKHCEHYANKTLNLVDGFVELARAQAQPLTIQNFDLGELIINTCDDAWVVAKSKQIKIDYGQIDGEFWFKGDPNLLERVFTNLINNAIQYSHHNTTVTCTIKKQENLYIAEVTDQGQGIHPDNLDKIFDAFTRTAYSSAQNPGGIGLGLAFVKEVIHRHKGFIKAESALGTGTKFIVTLPNNNID